MIFAKRVTEKRKDGAIVRRLALYRLSAVPGKSGKLLDGVMPVGKDDKCCEHDVSIGRKTKLTKLTPAKSMSDVFVGK